MKCHHRGILYINKYHSETAKHRFASFLPYYNIYTVLKTYTLKKSSVCYLNVSFGMNVINSPLKLTIFL